MTETPGFHLRRRLTQALVAHPYEAQYHGVTWLQQVQGFRMSETKGLQSSRPLIVALMCTLKEHRIAAIIRSQGLRDRGTRGLWLDRLTASLLVYYQVQSFTQEEAVGSCLLGSQAGCMERWLRHGRPGCCCGFAACSCERPAARLCCLRATGEVPCCCDACRARVAPCWRSPGCRCHPGCRWRRACGVGAWGRLSCWCGCSRQSWPSWRARARLG
eukprot:scaffold140318_cov18-Tisochrysis_lutea.AAC.1